MKTCLVVGALLLSPADRAAAYELMLKFFEKTPGAAGS
jgi:hypothetical protein